jgi:hypothetical protein
VEQHRPRDGVNRLAETACIHYTSESMGKIRRGGYMFIWWIGDHRPRHIHVFDKDDRLITRVNLETMQPMDIPQIEGKILVLIRQLQNEGRL